MDDLTLWLGAQADSEALMRFRLGRATANPPSDALPQLYQQLGNVACIRIQGAMVNGYIDPWLGSIFGVTGYDNVREAAIAAATNPDITGIVYNYATTGGDAAGVEDLGRLLVKLRGMKPSCAYTDSYMCSSGYWMGSSADRIISTNTAIVGSIGVKMMLVSRAKMLATAGIETKVIRYGDNKALGDSTEPITKAVVDHFTALAASMGQIFEQTVADNLGMTLQAVRKNFGQGSEFLGVDALGLGMVHEIGSFETALAYVRSSASTNQRTSAPTTTKGTMMKTELTIPPADDKTVTDPQASGSAALTVESLTVDLTAATAKIAELTAGNTTLAQSETALKTTVTTLQASLDKATTELNTLTAAKTSLDTAHVALTAHSTLMVAVIADAAKSMAVALNTTVGAMDTPEAALAEHARLSAAYSVKFRSAPGKVSGVPSTPAPAPAASTTGPSNLFHLVTGSAAAAQ